MTRVFLLEGCVLARKHTPDALGKLGGLLRMFARCGIANREVIGSFENSAQLETVALPELTVGLVSEDDFTVLVEHRDVGRKSVQGGSEMSFRFFQRLLSQLGGYKIFCVNGQLSIIDPTRRRHDRTQAPDGSPAAH